MRPVLLTIFFGTILLCAQSESGGVSLPGWLAPYPGSTATNAISGNVIQSSYTAAAKPDDVSAHYSKLFAARGINPITNFDGIGTSLRAQAPECDLLIQIREASAGTAVKVSCSPKEAIARPGAASVSSTAASRTGHLKSAEEIRQFNEDRRREIEAKRATMERQSTAMMQQYDKPVYPGSPPNPSTPLAHYRDDAPPLVWPSWLVSINGEHLSQPASSTRGPESSLSRKYTTTAPMTDVYKFYREQLAAHGFEVQRSELGAGSTSTGVKQNSYGEVEGYHPEGSGTNPPRTTITVSFSRMHLNEPISVYIRVSVTGSFGR